MKIVLMYASGARHVHELALEVVDGCNVGQALEVGGWWAAFPELLSSDVQWGVWGRTVGLRTVLREGDRVEVYRALRVDPKVARRERFSGQGARGTGLFSKRRPGSKAGY